MKMEDAYVFWKPGTAEIKMFTETGKMGLGPLPGVFWLGVCASAPRNGTELDRRLHMFITFNTIVVRDRVPAEAAHAAFLAIEEYRQLISPDTPGADT